MPLRPIKSTFKRRPKKKMASRSFRCSLEVDRMLDQEARRRGWTKSFLIKDIIHNWFSYHKAKRKVEDVDHGAFQPPAEK